MASDGWSLDRQQILGKKQNVLRHELLFLCSWRVHVIVWISKFKILMELTMNIFIDSTTFNSRRQIWAIKLFALSFAFLVWEDRLWEYLLALRKAISSSHISMMLWPSCWCSEKALVDNLPLPSYFHFWMSQSITRSPCDSFWCL